MIAIKIAQVTPTFPPLWTGTGNVCYKNSLELAKRGHDVTVYTCDYGIKRFVDEDSLKVKRFTPLFRYGRGPFLPQLMLISDFDIIHLHYPFIFGSELVLLNSIIKKNNYVLTYHFDPTSMGQLDKVFRIYTKSIGRSALLNAKKIIITTRDYAKTSQLKDLLGKRKLDVIEIPNGVDIKKFSPKITDNLIRKKYEIEDKKVILFVATLNNKLKGLHILLKSLCKFKQDVVLLVVGEGKLRKKYEKLSIDLGLSECVYFAGRVDDDELPYFYAASDVLILPSINRMEAFGLVLIEAMATGKPVIASNLPGVRTVVDDGINGFLVEPKNIEDLASKIRYLLENEDVRKKFGKKGREKVEMNYSWEKIGEKLESVYLEVLSS